MQNSIKVLAAALALGVSGGAFAVSTDGSLDATSSSDDVTVTVEVEEAVKITLGAGADAVIDFGTHATDGSGTATDSASMCVYHRGVSTVGVLLTSTKSETANVFEMEHGTETDEQLTYAITGWTEGTKEENITADPADSTCGSANNLTLNGTISTTDLDAAKAGTYTDTLTITVTPT